MDSQAAAPDCCGDSKGSSGTVILCVSSVHITPAIPFCAYSEYSSENESNCIKRCNSSLFQLFDGGARLSVVWLQSQR